jgi:catechol 2,3-dioxygenase-like lactoylglutathione lyase family enzyme
MPTPTEVTQQSGEIPTLAIDHVAFNVSDLESALTFFQRAFGCELINRAGPIDYGNGLSVRTAFLRYDPAHVFELLEWQGPNVAPAVSRFNDPGGGHLALAVADLDTALAAVTAQFDLAPEPPQQLPDGRRFSRFTTPWGLTVQLLTRPSASLG